MLASNIGYNKASNLKKREAKPASLLRWGWSTLVPKQPVNTDSSPVLNGDPAKMWRVSPVSTEAWLLGSQTKYLLWIKPDCWTIVTVAPQVLRSPRFSAPVCDLQHQQWAVPKQVGLQAPSAIQRPILPTFRAWTGQFTLISTKIK